LAVNQQVWQTVNVGGLIIIHILFTWYTHPHIWGPVWQDPTADCRNGHKRWDSCSCCS